MGQWTGTEPRAGWWGMITRRDTKRFCELFHEHFVLISPFFNMDKLVGVDRLQNCELHFNIVLSRDAVYKYVGLILEFGKGYETV